MKVGILSPIRFSVFSSGASSVALNLYDYLRELSYETELLNILPSEKNWYDDCSSLQSKYIVKSASSTIEKKYDLVIDCTNNHMEHKNKFNSFFESSLLITF